MDIKPLYIPSNIRHKENFIEEILDLFSLGYTSRCRREICKQLKSRTRQECLKKENGMDIETKKLFEEISKIIVDCLWWPNNFFILEDPCDLLFFEDRLSMQGIVAIVEIENLYGIDHIDYHGKSFDAFIKLVKANRKC